MTLVNLTCSYVGWLSTIWKRLIIIRISLTNTVNTLQTGWSLGQDQPASIWGEVPWDTLLSGCFFHQSPRLSFYQNTRLHFTWNILCPTFVTFSRKMVIEIPILFLKTDMLYRDQSGGFSRRKFLWVGSSNVSLQNSLRAGQESIFNKVTLFTPVFDSVVIGQCSTRYLSYVPFDYLLW